MLRERDGDDHMARSCSRVADTGTWPEALTARQAALLAAGADAVAWDLVFPEVFPGGFSVVLGNPPWDVVLPNTKDFVADFDPTVLDARTRPERAAIEQRVLARPGVAAAFDAYRARFDRLKRIAHRLYQHQRVRVGTNATAGNLDLFRLFAERNMMLAAAGGSIGVLMPSAFHANEGTTGIRRLYFRETNLCWCLSFENRRRIFDIDSRFKFDVIVAQRPGPTQSLRCGFYLGRIEDAGDPAKIMTYTAKFLRLSGGASLTPLELRGNADLRIAERFFRHPERLKAWCVERHIRFGCDLHMTADAGCFQKVGVAPLIVHEGKTFHQYTDSWDSKPRYSVSSACLPPAIMEAARYYRLAFRDVARSNDERTMIACIAPPGVVFGHTATVEKSPWARPNADALVLCALFNSFPFDWLVRQKATTHLSLYLLNEIPVPRFSPPARRFLAHGALLLSCNHPGYTGLLREQVGDERGPAVQRQDLRAQIDAVVADAYRLDGGDYAHILRSFSHRSFAGATSSYLAQFESIRLDGLEAFCDHHDPYCDVRIATTLPRPLDPQACRLLPA